jgi:hypothetical protein
VKRTI